MKCKAIGMPRPRIPKIKVRSVSSVNRHSLPQYVEGVELLCAVTALEVLAAVQSAPPANNVIKIRVQSITSLFELSILIVLINLEVLVLHRPS